MRILWNEVKKIFTWKAMLLLLFVNAVLYFLLIEFYITNFPNGSGIYSYNLGVEMVGKYGESMDEEEFADFKKEYEGKVEEADRFLLTREEFAAVGIVSYEDFQEYDWHSSSEEEESLRNNLFFAEDHPDLFWELQERERLIEFYERRYTIPEVLPDSKRHRFEELIDQKKFGVYTEIVIRNFKDFISYVGVAILFSVVLMVSPTMLKDRSGDLLPLQYTTKKGRNLFKTKLLAGYIAAFIVITGLLAVYFSLYSLNNTSMFFNVHINTFIANESWFDPTFLQFILLCVAAIYVIGFLFVTLSISFSSVVPNMVSLIGIQIPCIAGFLIFGLNPLLPKMILIWTPKWLAPILYSVLVLVCIALLIFLWKREKRRDILQ